jgi:hypothetical protein
MGLTCTGGGGEKLREWRFEEDEEEIEGACAATGCSEYPPRLVFLATKVTSWEADEGDSRLLEAVVLSL